MCRRMSLRVAARDGTVGPVLAPPVTDGIDRCQVGHGAFGPPRLAWGGGDGRRGPSTRAIPEPTIPPAGPMIGSVEGPVHRTTRWPVCGEDGVMTEKIGVDAHRTSGSRLHEEMDPALQQVLYPGPWESVRHDLPAIHWFDKAHALMLVEEGLIARDIGRQLLA